MLLMKAFIHIMHTSGVSNGDTLTRLTVAIVDCMSIVHLKIDFDLIVNHSDICFYSHGDNFMSIAPLYIVE